MVTTMRSERQTSDQRRGAIPDIRTDVGGITFVMIPPGTPGGERLVIRCDADGEVWISIKLDRAFSE